MNFSTLSMNSIVIAPSHLHMQIREQIVKERNGMLGLRMMSLAQFISSITKDESKSIPRTLLQVRNALETKKNSFTTYQSILTTPLFLKECYQFVNDIRTWNINIQELPLDTQAQKERYEIISCFASCSMPADCLSKAQEYISTHSFDHVYILETYMRLEDKTLFDSLCKQGAHILSREHHACTKEFYHSLNKRSEVEGCAQYIITHKLKSEDIHITLCDMGYQSIVKQVFKRYQIPFTMLQSQHASPIPQRFLSLIDFFLHPDSTHALACLDRGLFVCKGMHALREYVQIFQHDIFTPFTHVQQLQETSNIMDSFTIESLQTLEQEASSAADNIIPLFEQLRTISTISELLTHVCSIVKETLYKSEDIQVYTNVLALFTDVYEDLQHWKDLQFLCAFIEDLSISETPKQSQGILIHTLTQDILYKKHHFMFGATQANYPSFSTKKGIFDERYCSSIPHYPSMHLRYQHYMDELTNMFYASEYLVISYPLGTYEGKGMECALEIEQLMEMPSITYPLHTNYIACVRKDSIDAQTATSLFVHDHVMKGSISSIERYVKCPFSYFLRYGLSLREPMKPGFPESYAGTLSHFILETLINAFEKAYPQHAKGMIEAILHDEIGKLQRLFPAMRDALDNVKARIQDSMIQTIQILEAFEQHSELTPSKCEHMFQYDIPIEEDIMLSMRGVIDRIDESHEFACVFDYKSSARMLSETNVFAALQLQLLTYAMVIAKDSGKELLGAYYVSLKNENIPYLAGSVSRRKPVTHHINDRSCMSDERLKAHRLTGWTLSSHANMVDDDGNHIVGLRMNKEGDVKARKLYDLPTITNHFTTMYQTIVKRIIKGDIACKPIEEACTYCVYHEICRFNAYYEDKKQLIDYGDEIYQKGECEDA